MKPVHREEILDFVTYGEKRQDIRQAALKAKEPRRMSIGENLTFLFENRDTVRYQVLEMMRVEHIVKEADIQHELDTYNELLGGEGELGCTLLIEIANPAERDVKLREWLSLPESTYVKLPDGRRVPATFDPRQKGETRVSSVQFLKFDTGGVVPVAVGVDLDGYQVEHDLTGPQRAALADDLR